MHRIQKKGQRKAHLRETELLNCPAQFSCGFLKLSWFLIIPLNSLNVNNLSLASKIRNLSKVRVWTTMRIDYCMVVLDWNLVYALALLVSQYIVCSPWAVAPSTTTTATALLASMQGCFLWKAFLALLSLQVLLQALCLAWRLVAAACFAAKASSSIKSCFSALN